MIYGLGSFLQTFIASKISFTTITSFGTFLIAAENINVDRPNKANSSYNGPDGDNPFEKVEMTVKIMKQSRAMSD